MFKRLQYPFIYHSTKMLSTIHSCIKGDFLKRNNIKTSWGRNNFGDLMTPILLEKLGYIPINSWFIFSQIVCVGSILDALRPNYSGIIFGSGFLKEKNTKPLPKAKVVAVRGALTRDAMRLPNEVPLGDPGLLFSKLFRPSENKIYDLGIIPHYVDFNKNEIKRIAKMYPGKTLIIDVREPVSKVFGEISKCKNIISSSLHGLIIADSLGIPNKWFFIKSSPHGDRFKFDDYYSAFNEFKEPLILSDITTVDELLECCMPPSIHIEIVIDKLYKSYHSLNKLLG